MSERPDGMRLVFEDDFDGDRLDPAVWLPHYLPAWSSRNATAATYMVGDSCLQLAIPPEQGLWFADDHHVRDDAADGYGDAVPMLVVDYLRGYQREAREPR